MDPWVVALLVSTAALLAAPLAGATAAAVTEAAESSREAVPSASVAWLPAASDADMAQAFAQARREGKPLLLYWGANWCPPCNQLKATLFNRQDFIERSRAFVAVHVDGDLPGAQRLGARFAVRGYPTLVLFAPDGGEITRLPGEADAPQVMAVLQLGLSGGRPARAVLASARAGAALTPSEWQLLAFYGWDTDEDRLVPSGQHAALLAQLAAACPAGEAQTRLWLKSLAAAADHPPPAGGPQAQRRLLALFADPAAARAQMDVLTASAAELTRAVAGAKPSPVRAELIGAYDAALARLADDAGLSRADRSGAWIARVDLARIDLPDSASLARLPAEMLQGIRAHAARDDREIRDGYERQAVITTDADLLAQAGLGEESDRLLQANLSRSPAPFYLMSGLAHNARRRGDTEGALRWSREAWEKSVGPATRLQWGASYVRALVELAPADGARIEATAARVFTEAADQPAGFEERSARSLQRMGAALLAWNVQGVHAASLKRLRERLAAACDRLDPADAQRATCRRVLEAGAPLTRPS